MYKYIYYSLSRSAVAFYLNNLPSPSVVTGFKSTFQLAQTSQERGKTQTRTLQCFRSEFPLKISTFHFISCGRMKEQLKVFFYLNAPIITSVIKHSKHLSTVNDVEINETARLTAVRPQPSKECRKPFPRRRWIFDSEFLDLFETFGVSQRAKRKVEQPYKSFLSRKANSTRRHLEAPER